MRLILLMAIGLLLGSCSKPALDRTFSAASYKSDLKRMLQNKELSAEDQFIMNFAIARQRPYYNYEIEGKTYREILDLGYQLQRDGLPVEIGFNENHSDKGLEMRTFNEGLGTVRLGKGSRLAKTFNFSCTFENTSDQPLAIMNATFKLNGPFNGHVISAAYPINCKIAAGDNLAVAFVLDLQAIQKNILFKGDYQLSYLGIDELVDYLKVEVAGYSLAKNIRHYQECEVRAERLEPNQVFKYEEKLSGEDWMQQGADGKYRLFLGDSHYLPLENEEVIQMR